MFVSNSLRVVHEQQHPEQAPQAAKPNGDKPRLAVRTHVHAGGPRCGNQCVAYRKCLGDNDEWAAINCDM